MHITGHKEHFFLNLLCWSEPSSFILHCSSLSFFIYSKDKKDIHSRFAVLAGAFSLTQRSKCDLLAECERQSRASLCWQKNCTCFFSRHLLSAQKGWKNECSAIWRPYHGLQWTNIPCMKVLVANRAKWEVSQFPGCCSKNGQCPLTKFTRRDGTAMFLTEWRNIP